MAPPLPKKASHVKRAGYTAFPPLFVPDWLPLRQVESQKFYRNLEDFWLKLSKQRNFRIHKPLRTFIRPAKLLSKISFHRLFFTLAQAGSRASSIEQSATHNSQTATRHSPVLALPRRFALGGIDTYWMSPHIPSPPTSHKLLAHLRYVALTSTKICLP
jgi:hypothetical protein